MEPQAGRGTRHKPGGLDEKELETFAPSNTATQGENWKYQNENLTRVTEGDLGLSRPGC